MGLLAWLSGRSAPKGRTWCSECCCYLGDGFCAVCELQRGEDPYAVDVDGEFQEHKEEGDL